MPRGKKGSSTPRLLVEKPQSESTDDASTNPADRPLRVKGITFLKDENGPAHHTDEFVENCVVRRGQSFFVDLLFNKEFNQKSDKLTIELQSGPNPLPNKGTMLRLPVGDAVKEGEWSAAVEKADGENVKVRITSPSDAIIGRYIVFVETMSAGKRFRSGRIISYFVLLFNPWCKGDQTYLDDDTKLEEYVLNEHGYQYFGHKDNISQRPWCFGQFEPGILETCLLLLDYSGLKDNAKRSAVWVSRAMSKMVNSNDDDGVLVGKPSGPYLDGTPPVSWNGSVEILLQWLQERQPVKYGECLSFSGVMTTVLRCLGIPARSITNFESAVDTDATLTFDKYVDDQGNPLWTGDYMWMFHLWNEAWMTRPDLPGGYGGWQAVDATPQYVSNGVYQCGPCPVSAVKNGQVYLPFDTRFVFAAVNADVMIFQIFADDEFTHVEKLAVRKSAVGWNISTKKVGCNEREDITENYKHPEGTDQERVAVREAARYGSYPEAYEDVIKKEDVEFYVNSHAKIKIGEDVLITLYMKNNSKESRHVTSHLTANASYYTGTPAGKIGELEKDVTVEPGGEGFVDMKFTPKEYLDKLVEQAIIKVFVMAHVDTTKQVYVGEHDFRLVSPDLILKAPSEMTVGQQSNVTVEFTNPLDVKLSQAVFRMEGPGLQKPRTIPHPPIGPKKTVTLTEPITPGKAGKKTIVASFTSDKLQQVTGEKEVVVKKPSA
ncbi:protein-glutamine gamma-glutamyltransferase K-like [Branchiostoma lanceolatum]|uniref:protein-glutamine gamma-glutamyltransferase K-like n=1 Tax=Branchiostoma lanceolatum TaxID=7740 RepID=UPI00345647EA